MARKRKSGSAVSAAADKLRLPGSSITLTSSVPAQERELLRRCQAGDEDAWREFIEAYKHMVYSLAYEMLRNAEDAEDAAQEVFINAFRAIGSFRGDARLSTWLYRVTKNVCLNYIRQRDRVDYESLDNQEVNWEDIVSDEDSFPSPEEIALRRELREVVRRKIDELPPIYRTAIIMCDIQQLSYDEAAQILNVPVGTLKSQVFRGRRMLKEKLEEYWWGRKSDGDDNGSSRKRRKRNQR